MKSGWDFCYLLGRLGVMSLVSDERARGERLAELAMTLGQGDTVGLWGQWKFAQGKVERHRVSAVLSKKSLAMGKIFLSKMRIFVDRPVPQA